MQTERIPWASSHVGKWVMGWFEFNGTWIDIKTREQVTWNQRPLYTNHFNAYKLEFFALLLDRLQSLGIKVVIECRANDKSRRESPPPPRYGVTFYETEGDGAPVADDWGDNLMIVFINLLVDYSQKRLSENRPLI